jgi:tetratricopeptide (TPR) repeat protein
MNRDPLADAMRLAQAGNIADAARLCEQVLQQHPAHAPALALAGALALHSGNVASALKRLSAAVGIDARNAGTQAAFGDALSASGRHDDAIAAYRRAIAIEPRHAPAQAGLGLALQARGDAAGALAAFERAAALAPQSAPVLTNFGAALQAAGRLDEALDVLARARALAPSHPEPLYNSGVALQAKGDLAGAERAYRDALAQAPQHIQALHNLGYVLAQQGKPAPALEFYERTLTLAPDFAEAQFNRANALKDLGRFRDAIAGYDRVLARVPDHRAAGESRGLAKLTLGDLAAGWRDYLARALPRERTPVPTMPLPTDLSGRTIFLRCEQGLGDELFFLRFAPLLQQRGARVVSEADPRLLSLVRRHPGIDAVVPRGGNPGAHDLTAFQGDLPFLLGADEAPPVAIVPEPARLDLWRQRLEAAGKSPYVAVTWRAGVVKDGRFTKTAPPADLAQALSGVPGTIVIVQRAPRSDELAAFGHTALDLSAANGDLEDILALMALVDIYVGVSNTNTHLRAAVGRPAHVLVPFPPEWRWRDSGDQSSWFPGMRLYRERVPGDWRPAFAALARDLMSGDDLHTLRDGP